MSAAAGRLLLVEDEINMVRTLTKILRRRRYEVVSAPNGAEALARLGEGVFDVVITDLTMPAMDGIELLRAMRERGLTTSALVLTGHGTIQSAVEAMKLGALDYLIKPCHPDELLLKVAHAMEVRDLRREVSALRSEAATRGRYGDIVGKSRAMQEVYAVIAAVSQNKSNVLLYGENGTGKELVARAIHAKSPSADKPFMAINCGALAETLLESQLFGHRKGSFTGAVEDHDGVFQAASGGTLFLDEISEIPLPLQVKFLRAIQEKEVTPLGSTRPVKVDVRIIAATNRDLEDAIRRGRFRPDLFYRLNVVPIYLPPLRERRDDIPALVGHFIGEFSKVYAVAPKRVTPQALERIQEYDWPGNIRELQNAIERAFALSTDPEVTVENLPAAVLNGAGRPEPGEPPADVLRLDDLERRSIAAALRRTSGNKNQAARLLGIDRQRLYRKIQKYALE